MFQFTVVDVEFCENMPVFVTCMFVSIFGKGDPARHIYILYEVLKKLLFHISSMCISISDSVRINICTLIILHS